MSAHTQTNHVPSRVLSQKKVKPSAPSHRHAAPSAPWPWINTHNDVDAEQLGCPLPPVPLICSHKSCGGCWREYPKSRFPNWTEKQVERSLIAEAIVNYRTTAPCITYRADIGSDGIFVNVDPITAMDDSTSRDDTWDTIVKVQRPSEIRVRALFVENLSGPILQMLGTRFNIEPFFFSSTLHWTPSRFQTDLHYRKGDHITVTLVYLKSTPTPSQASDHEDTDLRASLYGSTDTLDDPPNQQMVDTQAPLRLRFSHQADRQLVLDLLSVHLIRHVNGSTIISLHPETDNPTTAKYLHERIKFAGQSVYWQKIFGATPDPTFVLLIFLWQAIYAWDEALEDLYAHISQLETRALSTSNMKLSQELHVIRAHLHHYSSLLEDFRKTVNFVRQTWNPAMASALITKKTRQTSSGLMQRECRNLLNEIDRLDHSGKMVDEQLQNVMNLLFSSVKITMTDASIKDSAVTRQIAFVTMIYLPLSFAAGVFSMNVKEINPNNNNTSAPVPPYKMIHYAVTSLSFILASIWIIIAFQSKHILGEDTSFWKRLGWPYLLLRNATRGEPEEPEDLPKYSY